MGQFTEKKSHPKRNGKFGSFRKVGRITPNANALAEGVLPDPNSFKMYEYRYTLARYGDYIQYSDEAAEYCVDDIDAVLTEEMAYAFKDFIEDKRTALLETSKNIWYASKLSNGTETAVTAVGSLGTNGVYLNDLPKIAAFFRRNHVSPARGSKYVILIPPEALVGLQSMKKDSVNFTLVELDKDAGRAEIIYKGEEGGILNFVFVASNSIKVKSNTTGEGQNAVTNYYANCFILGKVNGKWGTEEIALEGESAPEMIRKGLESGGVGNALNQVASIGWKHHGWGGIVKNEEAVAVYKIGLGADGYAEFDDTNRNTATNLHSEAGKKVVFTSGTGTSAGTFAGTTAVTNGVKSS